MKELQNFVYRHMDALKHHKRYLAMLTALSMLVTFIVPLILMEPADSMTKQRLMLLNDTSNMAMVSNLNNGQDGNVVNGVAYSPAQLSEVSLLIGDGVEWAQGCLDADDVIEAAKREYFIGIASDFCVFLEGDLKPKGADAEGRVAVGGNITFTGDYNYQLGAGDYTTMTALINTDNYNGVTNFAHAIVGGYVKRINILSTVGNGSLYYERPDASSLYQTGSGDSLTVYYPENEDLYKRIAIGNATAIDNCQHMTWLSSNNWAAKDETYNTYCEHDKFHPNELAQFYQADLIDFEAVFEWLKTQSQKLSNKTATGTSQVQDGVVTFTGPGQNSDAVTIYFDLEQWDSDIREVRFIDVPENANLVVNCGGNIVKIGSEYGAVNFSTSINGEVISIIDSSGTKVNANNRKESEQILYNFYECGTDLSNLPTTDHGDEIVPYSLFVNTNFNGTILAPYAIVASDKECRGHLSGSLIAQKFTGGLEFGYRPYRGGADDILGSTAGYVVPFDKFVDDLNGNGNDNPRLAGATFEIKDEKENIVDTWTSTEETSYITFPTELDFAGGKTYTEDNKTVTHTYTVSEKSAPEGYTTTAETYSVEVKETVDLGYLLPVDNGTIPTRATVEIIIFKNSNTDPVYNCKMIVEDTYSDNGIIQRIIAIDGSTKEYYVLNIESGNVTSVGSLTEPSDLDYIWTVTVNEEVDVHAMNVDGVDVLEDETDTSAENTEEAIEESTEETEEPTQSENQEETVEKTDPPIPTGLTIEYGKALNTVALPDGWTWNSPNDTVSATVGSTVSHKAKYAPSETSNYNAVERDITLAVVKATPNYTIPTGLTIEYGKALNTVALPDGWTWNSPNDTVSATVGSTVSRKAKYTPSDTNNYNIVEEYITFIVTKAQPAVNPVLNPSSGYTQGDTLPTITISNGDTAGTISWVNSTAKLKYGENVLEWEFTPDEGNNYEEATGEITITASAIPTNPINLEKGTQTAQKLSDDKHYYDPTSLMIMPLPDETPSFTNEYALVFKKQSDESTALAGATIELQSGTISNGEFNLSTTHGADSTPPWEWGNETNTYSIPLKKIQVKDLGTNVVYRFFEQTPPEGYEIAKPIYFVKTDNKTIRYTNDETKLSDINSWTPIEFSESNKSSNIITMTDYKIYGPEIKLEKVSAVNNSTKLAGAQFKLYAVNGDTLIYPVGEGNVLTSGNDGTIDFTAVFKANPNNCNKDYIKNGYLIPGEYYLKETTAPSGYDAPTDNLYFVVNETANGQYEVKAEKVEKPKEVYYSVTNVPVGSDQKLNINKTFDTNQTITKIEITVDNVSGDSSAIQIKPNGEYKEKLQFPLQVGSNIFEKEKHFADEDVFINTNGEISINAWNCSISEIKFYTTSSDTVTIPTEYTLSSEPVFSSGDAYYTIENVGSNTSGSFDKLIELGAENAGKKITRVVYFVSNASGAGVQLKNLNDSDTDISNIQDNNITNEGLDREYTDRHLNNSGKCRITAWNCTIDKVYIYLEGMESTGSCDLTVSSVKAYYLDGKNKTAASIDNLSKKDNIIGLEVTLGGSGSGNIQVNDAWQRTGVNAGETITFGVTDYTPPSQEEESSTLISVKDDTTDTLIVGNNKAGANTSISVEKKWNDSENVYSTRPESITVQLMQDGNEYGEPVDLNSANGWKHTWTDIPRLKENSDTDTYKYTVKEIEVPTGYIVTYDNNEGIDSGLITIKNELETTEISVEKKWVDSEGKPVSEHPNSITVQLQKKIENSDGYSDVVGKTLVLNSGNNWQGKFENLPKGDYQVVESVVPRGWTESRVTENGKTTITNKQQTGALKIKKIWENDNSNQRPENITIKIYRTITPPTNNNNGSGGGTTGGDNNVDAIPPENSKYKTVTEDYARLLQYSLYFYDANMCGDEVTENSVYSWRNTNCHTYDGEYAGGFHDAGDHAMFGLPQGFTASTLGWTYNEYKTTFDSLGLKSHYQLIMKEFCDFFVKSTKMSNGSVSDLLLDKGDAGTDHSYWGSPEAQTQGERGGLVWANSSNSGGNIAAEYAAALASYYLNFPNDTNSSTYLEYAKALYDYSNVKNSPRSIGGIYEDKEIASEQAWAAAWLYLATNEEQYKNDCVNKLNSINFDKRGHFWGEPALGAAIIYTTRIDSTNTTIKNKVANFLNDKCTGDSFQVLDGWGSARHNTLLQLTALTYDKYQETSSYKDWCKKQMAFILGDNTINGNDNGVCFVTGFKDGDSDTNNDSYLPQHPHHRAASGYNGWNIFNDAKQNGTNTQYKYAHTLIGALVGGPNGNSYNDNIDDTVCNEVAIDYNAGLVGAAAALYSVYGTGHTVNADVMKADGLEIKDGKTIYEEQSQAASISIGDIMNTSVMSFKRNAVSVLDNNTVEMMYPAYTTSATVTNNQEIRVKNVFSYTNLTKIEVDYTINNSYGGGYDMSILTSDDENNGYSNGKEQVDENTVRFTVLSWAKEKTFTGFRVKIWNMDSLTINEIRFYYEGTGPNITITNAPTTALKIGVPHQLSASGVDSIGWRSSSEKVSVDNGNVIINEYPENGKVTITAYDTTNQDTKAEVTINVEALSLTPPSSNVVIGDKVTYSANYDGFTIEDKDGYSVNGKEITATSTGNHTVSATYAGSSATASLNVSALQITNLVTPLGVNATHTFGVNGDIDGHTFEWISSDPTVLSFDENVPGLATTHKSGNVKIKVIKDGEYQSDEYDVAVQKGALSISVQPTQIRAGGTAELSATNTEGDEVEYSCNSDFITISGNTITAGNLEIQETVVITGTLGQESATCNLTIIPLPSISAPDSKNRIGIGETLQLTASNILGTATWRSEDTSILTVDENGLVTGVSTGTKTIIVEDTDGTIGIYEITVAELAADPGLPDEKVLYKTITLSSADLVDDNWVQIVNLPLMDENGNLYYYYIEEVTTNDVINGNGGKYMPIKYEGNNGVTLNNEVGSEVPEISVTNRLTQTIQGQLPSTGGSGVTTYYYLGGVIMLLSIAGFTGLKRREKKRRKE